MRSARIYDELFEGNSLFTTYNHQDYSTQSSSGGCQALDLLEENRIIEQLDNLALSSFFSENEEQKVPGQQEDQRYNISIQEIIESEQSVLESDSFAQSSLAES